MNKLKTQRLSDIITAIFIPVVFILCIHVSVLSRDLRAVTNGSYTDVEGFIDDGQQVRDANGLEDPNSGFPYPNTGNIQGGPNLNITGKARSNLLLLSPILRSGASSLRKLLYQLKTKNGFMVIAPEPKDASLVHIPNIKKQESIAGKVSSINQTAVVIDSFAFINFTRYGFQQPIQVSMVRDPVERAISWYYYVRAPYQVVEKHALYPDQKLPSRQFLRKSLESCLLNARDEECHYTKNQERLGHTIEFFCGSEHFCKLYGNDDGLIRAKEVVESSFAVVGIAEEWNKTMAVLEHYIPKFFRGSSQVGQEIVRGKLPNSNMYRAKVEPWAKEELRKSLALEYEFYQFLLQRLYRQYEAIRKRTK